MTGLDEPQVPKIGLLTIDPLLAPAWLRSINTRPGGGYSKS